MMRNRLRPPWQLQCRNLISSVREDIERLHQAVKFVAAYNDRLLDAVFGYREPVEPFINVFYDRRKALLRLGKRDSLCHDVSPCLRHSAPDAESKDLLSDCNYSLFYKRLSIQ